MSETCGVCGQFTGQTESFDLWIRGMDRRGETDRIEMDVSGVSVGECCGLGVLDKPEEERVDRPYQRYLNETPDGELRYVVMVRDDVDAEDIEIEAVSGYGHVQNVSISPSSVRLHPVIGKQLPESMDGYVLNKVD